MSIVYINTFSADSEMLAVISNKSIYKSYTILVFKSRIKFIEIVMVSGD
jgi:hypothetical protein